MPDFSPTRRALLASGGALLAAPSIAPAWAQDFPARPIRLVIPFPAGGPTDVYARFYSERMSRELGQPVVTENRGGAGGAIGSLEVARARPDGHTLLFGTASTHALYNLVTRQPQYDAQRDFQAVAMLGGGPLCWLAHPAQPATLTDFLAAARSAAPPLAYGSPGTGTLMHLATEIVKREGGGVPLNHIPYRGAAPAMNDLVAGTLALAVNTLGAGLPLHQGGRARMLAVASAARAPQAPDVPTAAEALGRPGFTAVLWHAVFAPPGLPAPVLARLSQASNAALADAAFRTSLAAAGIEAASPGTPESAATAIAAEVDRYRPIVEAIRPELDA
ncbi:Bug family tripartite tricarboxylate transporter substrate binding protein [Falsiroseomonas tokyonensis]|uniref:Bug family tripartite tricarboxylate transporter substrate binding protein n=1 Tax=Falsiroseomonas tokyonensis TaxID=430521 RepID=A0ABV7C0Y2_9PROT|nr:tripartite tricarboxylate transporter substrate binding protein [Falsiroseomonas tokyonensis]MBU8539965.1 tripartite tricarboxylate transporter substrate binding protein [Falsiroseomonas tokyonensis]